MVAKRGVDTGDQLATKDPVDLDSGIDYEVLESVVRIGEELLKNLLGQMDGLGHIQNISEERDQDFDLTKSPEQQSSDLNVHATMTRVKLDFYLNEFLKQESSDINVHTILRKVELDFDLNKFPEPEEGEVFEDKGL
ncbi:hypothetical protein Scep_019143 [Stephania cephalantha]|uniref:Uncharacterized protein n=1 Tax=Stephania cephalantha TaxID=152367 RepID=A0AAP0NMK5_9MAGN